MLATICGGGIVIKLTSLSGLMPPDASQYRIHIACVPGGNVMANVSGSPAAFALSASGLICEGCFTPAAFSLLFSVMAWPFRFSSHGMTIGFTGDPASPIVEASGMPISMCVAWFSPSDSLSRMTAHDASFEMTELIPNFLK
jgi:hypothetical protein